MEKIVVMKYAYNDEINAILNETVEIENSLESMQKMVGGNIEVYPLTDELVIVCNEEGKLYGLPCTAIVISDFSKNNELIVGDFFVCRRKESDLCGLWKEDLYTIPKRVHTIDSIKELRR